MFNEKYGRLSPMPGNHEVAISHSVYVPPDERGKGIGQQQHKERLDYLNKSGHGYVLCTVNADNHAERHILGKNGWRALDSFISPCNCHTVMIFGRAV